MTMWCLIGEEEAEGGSGCCCAGVNDTVDCKPTTGLIRSGSRTELGGEGTAAMTMTVGDGASEVAAVHGGSEAAVAATSDEAVTFGDEG